MLRLATLAALVTALVPAPARGARWLRPVDGPIVGAFSFDGAAPYAAGRRRGIVLAAAPGASVLSACTGRVAFAGSVGRAGPTVSVQCGPLRATYQGIASAAVSAGEGVARGARLARLGANGRLRLGARVARGVYVDPAELLGADRPPLGPAPRVRRPRRAHRPPRPRVVARPAVPGPAPAPARAPRAPLLAWAGVALGALALPGGALVHRRQRLRRCPARAAGAAAPRT